MECGSQTAWGDRIPPDEIAKRKHYCLLHLGMEIAPHLLRGPVRVEVTEETTVEESGRVLYTLRARVERD